MPGLIEIAVIAGLVLFLFGYKRIPVMGKLLGRSAGEFKKSFSNAANLPGFLRDIEEESSGKPAEDGKKRE